MTIQCPICNTIALYKYRDTPYCICPACSCWFQDPLPPKKFWDEETGGKQGVMSEADRQINRNIAAWLFRDVMKSTPGRVLDIGASLPVLAAAFADLGCDATVVEGDPVPNVEEFAMVKQIHGDFESIPIAALPTVELLIMVHTFEHMYNPIAAIRKMRASMSYAGRVYIRLPQHDVSGFERDLTPGHYAVHGFYHSHSSILEILQQTKTFVVESYAPMEGFGQADFILSPI